MASSAVTTAETVGESSTRVYRSNKDTTSLRDWSSISRTQIGSRSLPVTKMGPKTESS